MVDVRLLFGVSVLLGLVAAMLVARYYVWDRLEALPRDRALTLLALPHVFRFVGLSFLVDGVVSPSLPMGFAVPAAYGDLATAVLAIIATIALDRRASWATAAAWIMNVVGTCDLMFAFYRAGMLHVDPRLLGSAFFIPTVLVPLLLMAHAMSFRLLSAAARQHRLASVRRR